MGSMDIAILIEELERKNNFRRSAEAPEEARMV